MTRSCCCPRSIAGGPGEALVPPWNAVAGGVEILGFEDSLLLLTSLAGAPGSDFHTSSLHVVAHPRQILVVGAVLEHETRVSVTPPEHMPTKLMRYGPRPVGP